MKKWILKHRKIVTAIIIACSILLIFFVTALFWNSEKTKFEFSELLYYSTQIVSALFVISGVVIAIWQYYLSCIDSKRNIDVIRVQKAVDLSEYYKDNILSYIAPLKYIYNNSGISDIISKIDVSQMKHFDEKELYTLLSNEDINSLKEIQQSDKFRSIVINANLIYNLGLNNDLVNYYKNNKGKSDDGSVDSLDSKILSTFLGKLITRILNNMEYFSLHFTHNVADESVIYKSLHQTYIYIVQMLYYNIAIKNPLSPTKYFTNIIELYELWNNRAKNDEERFANDIRNLSNKGTVVENNK